MAPQLGMGLSSSSIVHVGISNWLDCIPAPQLLWVDVHNNHNIAEEGISQHSSLRSYILLVPSSVMSPEPWGRGKLIQKTGLSGGV